MTKTLKRGDEVAWETSQGETQGKIVRKQIRPMTIKGHTVASPDDPQYVVESAKSGERAAHKPDALRKI